MGIGDDKTSFAWNFFNNAYVDLDEVAIIEVLKCWVTVILARV